MNHEAGLQELLDERAIRDVLATYCHAIDRCDRDELASVYHPGAIDDHGMFSGPAEEYVEWVIPAVRDGSEASQHQLGNVRIHLDGDAAHVESYLIAVSLVRNEDGALRFDLLGGRYVDRFECRDGEWKIAHRQFVAEWDHTQPHARSLPVGTFAPGLRSVDDPSYVALRA
jgi:ketosteroid isomerase-like protein